jgi:hypothetical protein
MSVGGAATPQPEAQLLAKPFATEQLKKKIRSTLDGWFHSRLMPLEEIRFSLSEPPRAAKRARGLG